MKRMTLVGIFCALTLVAAACGSDDSDVADSSSSAATRDVTRMELNQRGAIEVELGEPVEVTTDEGELVLRVTDTRLDTEGCSLVHPEVAQSKFAATIETGSQTITQWLWPSDVYYVDGAGKVAQNLAVTEEVDSYNPCEGSGQFIDIPPNSAADGSPTLTIPLVTVAIGYHLEVGDVDQRIEWKLPSDWAATAQPTPTTETPPPSVTATGTAEVEPEPAPATTEPPAACADGDVVNEGGGTYSTCQGGEWIYVSPTFDPDSGDGYGPDQPLPPLCVRFPDQYTC